MAIAELSCVRLRSGRVEHIYKHAADEGWEPARGLEGAVVHAYPGVPLYTVEITAPPDGRTLALLEVREEDLEVTWTPDQQVG